MIPCGANGLRGTGRRSLQASKTPHHRRQVAYGRRIALSTIYYVGGQKMQIINLMTVDPITIDQHDKLSKAKAIMTAGNFRRVPVVDDGRLVGILTERDLHKYSGFLESTRVTAAMRTS